MEINTKTTSLRDRYLQGKLSAVIWDMDGVLADTMTVHFQAFETVLQRHGWSWTEETAAWGAGRRDKDILGYALQQNKIEPEQPRVDTLVEEKVRLFTEIVSGSVKPIPGVEEWLAWLSDKNIPCAVASSSSMAVIIGVLQAIGLPDYFQVLISGVRFPHSKPDPTIFLTAAAALNTPPQNCLVIEDAPVGIEAAHRAGMACLALATTYPAERLAADVVIKDLSRLPPQIIFP